mgnify:FL=1
MLSKVKILWAVLGLVCFTQAYAGQEEIDRIYADSNLSCVQKRQQANRHLNYLLSDEGMLEDRIQAYTSDDPEMQQTFREHFRSLQRSSESKYRACVRAARRR